MGPIEAAETKKTMGFHAASTLTPQASYDLIGKKVKAALGRLHDFKPYVLATPVTVDISFKHYTQAETLAFLRIIERMDAHAIRFRARDMLEAADFMEFVTTYGQDLQP